MIHIVPNVFSFINLLINKQPLLEMEEGQIYILYYSIDSKALEVIDRVVRTQPWIFLSFIQETFRETLGVLMSVIAKSMLCGAACLDAEIAAALITTS